MVSEPETKLDGWWRWPLLPFAAVAGAVVGTIVILMFLWFAMKLHGGYTEDGWYFRYVMPVISSAVFGFVYTAISCVMAPRGKVIAGSVMATLLGIFCLISVLVAWFAPGYPFGKAIQSTVAATATMVASVMTIVGVARDE